jgi:hypothetical protein
MTHHKKRRRRPAATAILSGADWVNKFPTSKDVADLASPFREDVQAFITAMQKAAANIDISATYRPAERAFLMHYSYRIARMGFDPRDVPVRNGVDINWVHTTADGKYNAAASKNAAEDMVGGYGIVFKPALNSNHTRRLAIDMTITWDGTLNIKDAQGKLVSITSTPRSGQNSKLISVGKTFAVLKLESDPPHWSVDGG